MDYESIIKKNLDCQNVRICDLDSSILENIISNSSKFLKKYDKNFDMSDFNIVFSGYVDDVKPFILYHDRKGNYYFSFENLTMDLSNDDSNNKHVFISNDLGRDVTFHKYKTNLNLATRDLVEMTYSDKDVDCEEKMGYFHTKKENDSDSDAWYKSWMNLSVSLSTTVYNDEIAFFGDSGVFGSKSDSDEAKMANIKNSTAPDMISESMNLISQDKIFVTSSSFCDKKNGVERTIKQFWANKQDFENGGRPFIIDGVVSCSNDGQYSRRVFYFVKSNNGEFIPVNVPGSNVLDLSDLQQYLREHRIDNCFSYSPLFKNLSSDELYTSNFESLMKKIIVIKNGMERIGINVNSMDFSDEKLGISVSCENLYVNERTL